MRADINKFVALGTLLGVMVIVAACGGGESTLASNTTATLTPTSATTPNTNPTETSTPVVAATATPVPTEVPDSGEPSLEAQIAAGKIIYEKTAGGIGCAACHGFDALGDPLQAVLSGLSAHHKTQPT